MGSPCVAAVVGSSVSLLFVFRLGTAGNLRCQMVLQCYDFLADSAIPTDRYLLLCGDFSWRRGSAEISERWGHLYMGVV